MSYRILHDELPSEVRREGVPGVGAKGSVESVIVALGSAGVVSALVQCFKAWIGRDRTRRIVVTWVEDGKQRSVTVDSTAIGRSTVERLGEDLARKFEGGR